MLFSQIYVSFQTISFTTTFIIEVDVVLFFLGNVHIFFSIIEPTHFRNPKYSNRDQSITQQNKDQKTSHKKKIKLSKDDSFTKNKNEVHSKIMS